jgi:hypothetical protein
MMTSEPYLVATKDGALDGDSYGRFRFFLLVVGLLLRKRVASRIVHPAAVRYSPDTDTKL